MNLKEISDKRQKKWKETDLYKVTEDASKPKFYILDMFPYPSGSALHVGHPKGYIATDALTRKKMLEGFNVLHPMGFDTFGLGTEQYAIDHKMKPQDVSKENIAKFIQQLEDFGTTYDRSRCVNTADPKYFKWTQRVFLQMYNHYYDSETNKAEDVKKLELRVESGELKVPDGLTKEQFINSQRLAYVDYKPINRCPKCMTGLANEDLDDGKCERCGSQVEQKPMKQWVLRITKYAERMLEGLDTLNWEESMKDLERNRIGKSIGTNFTMVISNDSEKSPSKQGDSSLEHSEGQFSFSVYTTRIDTVFGMSFVAIAPEHPLVDTITTKECKKDVEKYKEAAKKKSQLERTELQKEKTGVFCGAYAINPFTNQKVPVFVADYVLANYGTGVVMAVPAHDERDFEFAKKYKLPITRSISSGDTKEELTEAYTPKGTLVDSGEFTELQSDEAITKMNDRLEKNKKGGKKVNYKMQDRVFSRQRYRGEPFPVLRVEDEPKLTVNFYNNKAWNAIVDGAKTIETRALNPEESDKYFGDVKVGDVIKFQNKESGASVVVQITKGYHWDNFAALRKDDKKIIEKMFYNTADFKKVKTIEDLKAHWNFLDGYIERIERNGLVGREFDIIQSSKKVVAMDEKELPLELPAVENYEPTGTEEGPLANVTDWVNVTLADGTKAKRETNTMPGWAGSSRYRLRYMDPNNDKALVGKDKEAYRGNVDVYVGGAEHITRHVIYGRFWQKFLYDIGIVTHKEPFQEYHYVGLIMGEDGRKMSKRRGNVVNPDEIINQFGADTLRTYEMFMGPFDQTIAWNTAGISGTKKFLDKVTALSHKVESRKSIKSNKRSEDFTDLTDFTDLKTSGKQDEQDKKTLILLHQTIKKVSENIDEFKFNTAVSQLMILTNHLTDGGTVSRSTFETLVILLSPFAPHLAEELWEQLGNEYSIFNKAKRPQYDEKYLVADTITIAVQVNGKVRGTISIGQDAQESDAMAAARADEKIAARIVNEPKKVIYVKGKILNIVV